MLNADEDAVICDFAQTYHILDYRAMDPGLAAVLAWGLPPDSRIKQKMTGRGAGTETVLLAAVFDKLAQIAWMLSEDGARGRNRPTSVSSLMLGKKEEKKLETFATGEDFLAEWRRLSEEDKDNG